jgi:hypothetical protein
VDHCLHKGIVKIKVVVSISAKYRFYYREVSIIPVSYFWLAFNTLVSPQIKTQFLYGFAVTEIICITVT